MQILYELSPNIFKALQGRHRNACSASFAHYADWCLVYSCSLDVQQFFTGATVTVAITLLCVLYMASLQNFQSVIEILFIFVSLRRKTLDSLCSAISDSGIFCLKGISALHFHAVTPFVKYLQWEWDDLAISGGVEGKKKFLRNQIEQSVAVQM